MNLSRFSGALTFVLGDQELHIIEASSSNRLWNKREGNGKSDIKNQ